VRRFGRTDNQHWLIERHGYRTPIEARDHLRALRRPPQHDQLVHQSVRRTGARRRSYRKRVQCLTTNALSNSSMDKPS
jgi:hypothetical protein